jgi:hypothetical protein
MNPEQEKLFESMVDYVATRVAISLLKKEIKEMRLQRALLIANLVFMVATTVLAFLSIKKVI